MSGQNKTGEVELEMLLPFEYPHAGVAMTRHTDGSLYILAVAGSGNRLMTVT